MSDILCGNGKNFRAIVVNIRAVGIWIFVAKSSDFAERGLIVDFARKKNESTIILLNYFKLEIQKIMTETQEIEYKDFSKAREIDEKLIIVKMFKEISAFANSNGGTIIIGIDDKTDAKHRQPDEIIRILNNDFLTKSINNLSDNLLIFNSSEEDGIITIKIPVSEDVIAARVDSKGINIGDCFVRKNHEAIKVNPREMKKLIEKKHLSIDFKLEKLRKIVHLKYIKGQNNTSSLNIFDSIVIISNSNNHYAKNLFDELMFHQFIGSFELPFSKHSSITLYLNTFYSIQEEYKKK